MYIHNNNNKEKEVNNMKINKNFTIDLDIVEKLNKIDNSSKLINDLLIDYFEVSSEKSTIFDQKVAVLKQNKAKMKQIKKEIKIFKFLEDQKFDQKCINWIYGKDFKYEDSDIDNYISHRAIKLKIKISDFRKCSDIVQKNGYLFKHY